MIERFSLPFLSLLLLVVLFVTWSWVGRNQDD